MRIALIHDHLLQHGGAERVLEVMSDIFPKAPIYTIAYAPEHFPHLRGRHVIASALGSIPFFGKKLRPLVPFIPTAIERFPLKEFDVVLSNSSGFAKGAITHPHTLHICYCHTPTRYLWSDSVEYTESLSLHRYIKSILMVILTWLRIWDRVSAERVDAWVANSHTVARRIKKYYGKESTVIYPPVDIEKFSLSSEPKTYYLAGGRLVSYKRFDLIIEAFNKIGTPLIVFGTGPEEKRLRGMAGPNIRFVGRTSDELRAKLFAEAIAFIHPQEEDFGITPVESMASGRPVIALRRGGATETVVEGVTGTFFDEQSVEELMDTVLHFDHTAFSPEKIRAHAEQFGLQRFRKELYELVDKLWTTHRRDVVGK